MRFAQPYFIAFIVSVALLIAFYIWALRARASAWERFAQKELLPELLPKKHARRQGLKAVLLSIGICFCLVALLRPQWGFQWQEIKHRGLDIMIALDTSKSMLATDVKPSRLERAKLAIGDFAQHLQGDRIGLVAFAGGAFLECPLTIDYGGFLLSLENVDVSTIPKGGTSLSAAIREALRSFPAGQQKYKVLIIVTDGEDHEGDAVRLAEEAKNQGVIVYCIGIGTQEGELIFAEQEDGRKEFLKDSQGNAVKSRLNEELLQKIAFTTAGTYVRSTNTEFGLDLLYREKLSKIEKREFEGKMSKLYNERFQVSLLIALLLIVAEALINGNGKQR